MILKNIWVCADEFEHSFRVCHCWHYHCRFALPGLFCFWFNYTSGEKNLVILLFCPLSVLLFGNAFVVLKPFSD